MQVEPLSILAATASFGQDTEGWTLDEADTPNNLRSFLGQVSFGRPFLQPPVVHVGLVGFDIGNNDAARLTCQAQDITAEGFSILVETWLGTRIWSVSVSWLALGR